MPLANTRDIDALPSVRDQEGLDALGQTTGPGNRDLLEHNWAGPDAAACPSGTNDDGQDPSWAQW